jgi:hypothetical protein
VMWWPLGVVDVAWPGPMALYCQTQIKNHESPDFANSVGENGKGNLQMDRRVKEGLGEIVYGKRGPR